MMRPEERDIEHKRLQELTHQNLLRLIDSEFKLALTMSELAETESEVGDQSHAKGLLDKVGQALDSVRQYVGDGRLSDEEKRDIERRAQELTQILVDTRQSVVEGSET